EPGLYRTADLPALGYPVPPGVAVVAEMGDFARWLLLRPAAPDYLPSPILRATYAHTRLLHIHPFAAGNGRVARLLLTLILRRAG
ncbi:Fic family protein, partial [Escherichia coli]